VAAACAGVALWGMHDLVIAKRCLDGALYRDRFNGAAITPDACVIATTTGSPIRVALNGPSFVGTLLATVGMVAAAVATFVAVSAVSAVPTGERDGSAGSCRAGRVADRGSWTSAAGRPRPLRDPLGPCKGPVN